MPVLSSDTPTPADPFDPYVARVLHEARARLGQEEEGENQGAIVREVCAPFLPPERFEREYARGNLLWCAAFAASPRRMPLPPSWSVSADPAESVEPKRRKLA